jgi:hypothetical protein
MSAQDQACGKDLPYVRAGPTEGSAGIKLIIRVLSAAFQIRGSFSV